MSRDRDKEFYALSGRKAYLVREMDGNFSGRWNGFWVPPLKIIDWFQSGFRKNGRILWTSEMGSSLDYNFYRSKHRYHKSNLILEETILIPEKLPQLYLSLEPEGESDSVLLALKVNLGQEEMVDSIDTPKKSVEVYSHGVLIKSTEGDRETLYIRWSRKPSNIYTEPFQVQELTGKRKGTAVLEFSPEKIILNFAPTGDPGEVSSDIMKKYRKQKENVYNTFLGKTTKVGLKAVELEDIPSRLKAGIKLLLHSRGMHRGIFAGYPHYAMFFGRDTLWSSLGMSVTGLWKEVRDLLELLSGKQNRNGRIPHEIWPSGSVDYATSDSTILFSIALENYYTWSGDRKFLDSLWDSAKKSLEWAEDRADPTFIHHSPESFLKGTTWMDSRNRSRYGVDVQTLWLKSLESMRFLAGEMGEKKLSRRCERRFERVLKKFRKEFWNSKRKFLYDRIRESGEKDSTLTANPVLPCMFGYLDREKTEMVLDKLESPGFNTRYGLRTVAEGEKIFDASYQKGAVWPLNTSWMITAETRAGREDKALEYIRKLLGRIKKYPGCFVPEYFRENKTERPGCFLQAWSACMLLKNLIQDLFGIEPRAWEGRLILRPQVEGSLKDLRMGRALLNVKSTGNRLKVKNRGEKIEVATPKSSGEVKKGHTETFLL